MTETIPAVLTDERDDAALRHDGLRHTGVRRRPRTTARSSSGANRASRCSPATSTIRRRRAARSATAGSSPATAPTATSTAASSSTAAAPTCSRSPARTSRWSRSNRSSPCTRASPTSPSSARRTRSATRSPSPSSFRLPDAADAGRLRAELEAWCAERLGKAKRPRDYRFVDELPRTSVGKIKKYQLR